MLSNLDPHSHACDCAAHRPAARKPAKVGLWTAILPFLACAVCPACLTTYTKILSLLGIGFELSEMHHLLLLVVAITISVSVSAWRSWQAQRSWPIAIALLGSSLVFLGHFAGDLHLVEWAGVACLLAGGLAERFQLPRAIAPAQN